MCDYSLLGLRTRLAVEREDLVTYRFPTGSLGLTDPAELELYRSGSQVWWPSRDASRVACAVCIPHGSRLHLSDIPVRLQQQLGIGAEEEIVFIQMSAEVGTHRDGVRFANGQEILLQRLAEGQHAHVVSVVLGVSADETAGEVV